MKELLNRSGNRPQLGGFCLHAKNEDKVGKSHTNKRRVLTGLLAGVLAATLLCAPSVGLAGEKAAVVSKEGGIGAAAALSSLIYGPVKLIYATGGLVVGSFSWMFTAGDNEVAAKVFTRSLRGTYVITPGILLGEEPLEFIGRDVEPFQPRTAAVASAEVPPPAIDDSGYDEMGW
ncbi:MAG: hypothetical protein ABGX04_15165 [Myxococcales bacterium]|nr:hypothetical protein [Myxococcales bacterium]HIK86192.1 hypothetical protein [Myxococcales bacterium]